MIFSPILGMILGGNDVNLSKRDKNEEGPDLIICC